MKPTRRTGIVKTPVFSPISASPEEVVAALLSLYSRQTDAEVASRTTAEDNGIGFNAFDASILSSICDKLIATKTITDRQLSLVRSKLNKYRRQIQTIDLDLYAIDGLVISDGTVKKVKDVQEMTCTSFGSDSLKLQFGFDLSIINKVKALSGRRYHSKGLEMYWTVPRTPQNMRSLINMGFVLPDEAMRELGPTNFEFSFDRLKRTLRPYQIQGASRLAGELDLRGLLADEMGLGKTAQVLAAVDVRRKDAFPILVVCPSTLKWNWAREANMWLRNVTVRVLGGFCKRSVWTVRENEIAIINDDVLADQLDKNGKLRRKGWASLLMRAGYKTLILDECHRIKNMKKKTIVKENGEKYKVPACKKADTVLQIAKRVDYFLPISGTPIENRPAEFFPTLNALSPELFPNWWTFAHRYCDAKSNGWGWNFNGASNAEELHQILVNSVMIRRLKKDVLKDLPPKIRSVIPVEIDLKQYEKAETELLSYVAQLRGVSASAKDPKQKAEGLATIERLKQAAVLGKMKAAIEWIEDYLESGKKLVVFATHQFVLDQLEQHFRKKCVRVDGSTSTSNRMRFVDAFQGDDSIRLFLGNIRAAGVGITLTAASDTLTLELGWTPGGHDQAEDRVHRIGQDADSVTAWYIVAKDTIEEDIAALLDEKRDVLAQIMDGKPAKDRDMLTVLLKKYVEKLHN